MNQRASLAGFLFLGVLALVGPFFLYPVLVMELLCFAIFASAYHLALGYGGLLSFGHAAFFGLGAFMTGHAIQTWHWDPFWALILSTGGGLLLGGIFAAVALKRQGIYFAMITLALAQIIYFFFLQAPFTGGEDGLQGIPREPLLGLLNLQKETFFFGVTAPWGLYGLVVAIFLATHGLILMWLNSPSGLLMQATQSHENRARSLGLPTLRLKAVLFAISAALSGLAGGLKALVLGLATLSDAAWSLSGEVVLMNLLGGVGTFVGPAFGAFFLRTLHHEFADLGAWFTVVLGVTFVLCVMLFRRGLVGEFLAGIKRHR